MNTKQIHCLCDQQLVLTPSMVQGPNSIIVNVQYQQTQASGKTAVVSWGGGVRAFITFDPTGNQVLSYTLAVQDYATQQSIENIISAL
ncbi:hypothetical protein N1M2_123 [Klebsiella phage N1M2]|uniref:Uncharacterized protein n=1 Tax=Klebsiella phage N1M2 TaxID=2664939 RepID=A0A6B7ZET7_9CAUD|nr:hypothetical protein PQB72_gp123 [Klebsiella phage N1M2]QGH71986.1 hypothetical protein N1M2_123 [Klebsiella phage N1M2]